MNGPFFLWTHFLPSCILRKSNEINPENMKLVFLEKLWVLCPDSVNISGGQCLYEEFPLLSLCLSRQVLPDPSRSIGELPLGMRVQLSTGRSEGVVLSRARSGLRFVQLELLSKMCFHAEAECQHAQWPREARAALSPAPIRFPSRSASERAYDARDGMV